MLCTNFFKSSTDMYSRSICLARSMSAASARMQMDILGRGTFGSLYVGQHSSTTRKASSILDGSGETLVPLGVVVLQTDL